MKSCQMVITYTNKSRIILKAVFRKMDSNYIFLTLQSALELTFHFNLFTKKLQHNVRDFRGKILNAQSSTVFTKIIFIDVT